MNFLKGLKSFVQSLGYMLLVFSTWLMLAIGITKTINFINIERYQPNDIPNTKFQVVILDTNNQSSPIYFKDLTNQSLATEIDKDWYGEDYFVKKDDIYLYHNEGALWNTESSYKIIDGKVKPVSFLFFTFVQAFEAFVLAFVGYAMVKYAFLRFWYRRSAEKVRELNRAYLKGLKVCLIFIGVGFGFYVVMSFIP